MYEIIPVQKKLHTSIAVPGSKSITNRIFLIAALSDGVVTIRNALVSDDTQRMTEALIELGIQIEKKDETTFIIHGRNGTFDEGDKEIYLENAGTATRFLTTAMTLRNGTTRITGNKRMQERPIQDLIDGLTQLGVDIKSEKENQCPPITITSPGKLPGGTITIKGNKSSQYFSSVLISSPYGEDKIFLVVDGELVSKPYIDITINCMKDFGVEVINNNYESFEVSPQRYKHQNYSIEGDASSASYYFALAALTQSTITVNNVSYTSHQGDIHFVDVLEKMGCKVIKDNQGYITITGPETLKALPEIDMESMPDVAMTLAIVAACAEGTTKITGLQTLKIKETDRIEALRIELQKIGITVEATNDSLTIHGGKMHGAEIDTYDDHRMAMCFAILGCKVPGIKIKDPMCVTKTYPHFWEDLKKIGIEIT